MDLEYGAWVFVELRMGALFTSDTMATRRLIEKYTSVE